MKHTIPYSRFLFIAFIAIIGSVFFACQKPEKYPVVPYIEFKEAYTNSDTVIFDTHKKFVRIALKLRDGDGDIGWDTVQTAPDGTRYRANMFSKIYYKQDGLFNELVMYNLSNAVLDSLLAAGMPAEAIESLTDYVTDTKKTKLFQGKDPYLFIVQQFIGNTLTDVFEDKILKFGLYADLMNFTMPYVAQSEGQNKAIKAEVLISLEYAKSATFNEMPYDTLQYEIYMMDRAFNTSNIIVTPEIIFRPTDN